jgi:hypothetical protein
VSGLDSDEEVLELFARDLQPWFDQLPVDVTIVEIEDATEDERAERLGSEERGRRSPARHQPRTGPGGSFGPEEVHGCIGS